MILYIFLVYYKLVLKLKIKLKILNIENIENLKY